MKSEWEGTGEINSPRRPKSINNDCRGQRYILKAMKIFSKGIITENLPQLRNEMLIQIQEKLMTPDEEKRTHIIL